LAIFFGYWQLNVMLNAKTRKIKGFAKGIRQKLNQVASFFIWGAIGLFWALQEKQEFSGVEAQ